MKEPARAVNKVSALKGSFTHNLKCCEVLSKRSLIHSDSFQLKFNDTCSDYVFK